MYKPHRIIRPATRSVGDPSSKYGYDRDGKQFETDLQAAADRYDWLWEQFVEFMITHDVNPCELRSMFARYYEEFVE